MSEIEKLRESEERYRELVELSPDAIIVHNEGTVVFANPAAVRLMGAHSADELLGKPVMGFAHPDFRKWHSNASARPWRRESPFRWRRKYFFV